MRKDNELLKAASTKHKLRRTITALVILIYGYGYYLDLVKFEGVV